MAWKLVDATTGVEVKYLDRRETFRGEAVKVTSFAPPHKPESSGKVGVVFIDDAATGFYYPGVIGAKYVETVEDSVPSSKYVASPYSYDRD